MVRNDTAALDRRVSTVQSRTPCHETMLGNTARRLLAAAAPTASAVSKAATTALIEKHPAKAHSKESPRPHRRSRRPDCQVHLRPTADPFAERFTKIPTDQENGKNILVIVDDIDRLHSDELLSVMKAVRLLGRFDGVHYLLSYDEQTLLGVLEQTDLAETADLAHATTWRSLSSIRSHFPSPGIPPR
ncbi:hypothetical protein GS432_08005 [Rhodococcus hoagii]|nr:hypothetical protein [Prescottella equi]